MPGDAVKQLHPPKPRKLVRKSIASARRTGLNQAEAAAVVADVVARLRDRVDRLVYDHGCMATDVLDWLDALVTEADIAKYRASRRNQKTPGRTAGQTADGSMLP